MQRAQLIKKLIENLITDIKFNKHWRETLVHFTVQSNCMVFNSHLMLFSDINWAWPYCLPASLKVTLAPCVESESAVLTWNMFGGCPTNLSHLQGVSMSNEVRSGKDTLLSNSLSLLDKFSGFRVFHIPAKKWLAFTTPSIRAYCCADGEIHTQTIKDWYLWIGEDIICWGTSND